MDHYFQEPVFETTSVDGIRAHQLAKLDHLLTKTWSVNEFYRERWKAAGFHPEQVRSLDDLRRIPTLEKQDFLADQEQTPPYGRRLRHALGLGEPLIVCNTSGTSGQG